VKGGEIMMWKAMTGELLLERFYDSIIIEHMTDILARAEKVFDFLPIIKKDSPAEEKILKTWVDFFTFKKVPFIVVEEDGRKSLWKAEVVSEKERASGYWQSWKKNRKEK